MDDHHSDLCAQWKAADAAKDSANWALGSFIVAAFTLIAAGLAALYAKSAAKETKRSAEAAFGAVEAAQQANRISADTADRQLRAYLFPSTGELNLSMGAVTASCPIRIPLRNTGATPATLIFYEIKSFVCSNWGKRQNLDHSGKMPIEQITTNIQKIIGPNSDTYLAIMGHIDKRHFDEVYDPTSGPNANGVEFEVRLEWHYRDYKNRTWRVDSVFVTDRFKWESKRNRKVDMRQKSTKETLIKSPKESSNG
ncbi:hypothetical protein [uncultured Novosphingobium sp.]|uniref:hypothetical protein n=1 Tax=uncultured Novosphingobium sp. TaxID=292277 RepID=UPI00259905EF|nr:hypothetical protein [uncultured Novosphingobium sp.]